MRSRGKRDILLRNNRLFSSIAAGCLTHLRGIVCSRSRRAAVWVLKDGNAVEDAGDDETHDSESNELVPEGFLLVLDLLLLRPIVLFHSDCFRFIRANIIKA